MKKKITRNFYVFFLVLETVDSKKNKLNPTLIFSFEIGLLLCEFLKTKCQKIMKIKLSVNNSLFKEKSTNKPKKKVV